MIDTTKFYCVIDSDTRDVIESQMERYIHEDLSTGEVLSLFTRGSLLGSFDSRCSISTDIAEKYNLRGYVLIVEGSYHKFVKGYNSHNGFYDLNEILKRFYNFYWKCF